MLPEAFLFGNASRGLLYKVISQKIDHHSRTMLGNGACSTPFPSNFLRVQPLLYMFLANFPGPGAFQAPLDCTVIIPEGQDFQQVLLW